MKIAVIGCGAMGSIYAARLAAAGNEVLAVDRSSAHVDAIAAHGLRISGPQPDQVVPMRAATIAPNEPVDLVIVAVKAADVATGANQALPLLGENTTVLTIQNGLGSADTVAGIVGADRVAVGIASGFGASRPAPGHVHHNAMRAVRFGAYAALPFSTVDRIAGVWSEAGFDAAAVADIAAMQWEKLICNAAYSAPCALTGMTVGAAGIGIDVADPVAHVRAFGAQMPNAKPSALLDHLARRVSEIDVINGAVVRTAAQVGEQAPVNVTLTALVKAVERQWTAPQN
jgi:2-dehydropantoate 2-reductase